MTKSVLQDWVTELPLMQQNRLLAATRGCDGISNKDHIVRTVTCGC
jgi:hypothetical protein